MSGILTRTSSLRGYSATRNAGLPLIQKPVYLRTHFSGGSTVVQSIGQNFTVVCMARVPRFDQVQPYISWCSKHKIFDRARGWALETDTEQIGARRNTTQDKFKRRWLRSFVTCLYAAIFVYDPKLFLPYGGSVGSRHDPLWCVT